MSLQDELFSGLRPISKGEYYTLVKKVYVDELNWKPEKTINPSNIRIEDGQLLDDFAEEAEYFGFCFNDKPVFGFRMIYGSSEIKRYVGCEQIEPILESSFELNRLVVDKSIRKIGIIKLIGKVAFEFCKSRNVKYCVIASGNENLISKMKKMPSVKVFDKVVNYPEGACSAYAFPINSMLFRLSQSDFFVFGIRKSNVLKYIYRNLADGKL